MLGELINSRKLPSLKTRDEMVEILLKEEYGYLPNVEYNVSVSEEIELSQKLYPINDANLSYVNFTITSDYGSHTFKVSRVLYNDGKKHPFFIFINFRDSVPDFYYPIEEIVEKGFSVLSFCYKDVTSDDGDFTNGLAKVLLPNGQDSNDTAGKLMLWSFAASRVLDYAQSIDSLDFLNAAILGHSRLGKTALLTSMLDNRFKFAFSNCSGCSGASLSRGNSGVVNYDKTKNSTILEAHKYGETISHILTKFDYWFCKNYTKYRKNNFPVDFDQHYLLASIAPRFVYVGSGSLDLWADPISEFLNCVASSEAYINLGVKGLIHNDKLPCVNERFLEGRIGYHLREGVHFLSRHDWNNYMEFINLHKDDEI